MFRGNTVGKDGATPKEHMTAAQRVAAKAGLALATPATAEAGYDAGAELPVEIGYVWDWYLELRDGIALNGMAPAVITWVDVGEWSRLTGREVEPWEARTLVRLGTVRAIVESEAIERERRNQS